MDQRSLIIMLLLTILCGSLSSQSNRITFSISNTYGDTSFSLVDSLFSVPNSNDLQISTLRYYISGIQFLKDDKVVKAEENSFHLIDAGEQDIFQLMIPNDEKIVFDEVKFNLGIDSITNVSGVMGGDLDPTKGMYWTWQSGYINFKLEGKSSQCSTRYNEYAFHLGGYLPPNNCLQTLTFPVSSTDKINLILDIKSILDQVELSNTNHIMSPSKEAVELSEIVSEAFRIIK